MRAFQSDPISALAGGFPMETSKFMWLLSEHLDVEFSGLTEKFLEVRKRAFTWPKLGDLTQLVCILTKSGTAAEASRSR